MTAIQLVGVVSACVGIVLSVVQISLLLWREYEHEHHRTLSLVGAKNNEVLAHFRRILIICGTLITFGMLTAIAPHTSEKLGLSVLWIIVYLCEIGAALIPAVPGRRERIHTVFGMLMAAGMLTTAVLLVRILPLHAAYQEYVICLLMGALVVIATAHPKRFIFYEVPFIFLSHVSIAIAVFALR